MDIVMLLAFNKVKLDVQKDEEILQKINACQKYFNDAMASTIETANNITSMLRSNSQLRFSRMTVQLDNDLRIKNANTDFNRFYGMENISGIPISCLFTPEEKTSFEHVISQLSPKNNNIHTQTRYIRNGQECIIDWINKAIFNENGEIIEYQRLGYDVTPLPINS
jgi:hypothetical protein